MIRIQGEAWKIMVDHAERAYPNECCGAMLGTAGNGGKAVSRTVPLENVSRVTQRTRYELRPEDLLAAEKEASRLGLALIGIYHSHPDCGAYFSETDLKNSCPWYSFVVLSVEKGEFRRAACFQPEADQTAAREEELICGD